MRNLLKIGALSLALVAVVLMLNTNAAFDDTGDLKLRITGTSGSCNYGTYLDLNEKPFSYTAYTWSGNFITTTGTAGEVGGNQWSCTDSYGVAFWALTLKSSDLLNISTGVPAHTIGSGRVHLYSDAVANVSGFITEFSGLNNGGTLNATKTIIEKMSAVGDAGRLATDNVDLTVDINASQAIGQYSGTLTVNVPNL